MPLPRIDRLVSVNLVSPILRRTGGTSPRRIPILMYHSVSDDPEPGVHPYYRLATPPALFRDHLSILSDEGFSVVSLHEAAAALSRCRDELPKVAVITFDDGFRDFLTDAWPALSSRSFTATVFLPTAFIAEPRRTFVGRECLTWSEVRDLRNAGVRFGSHTVSHPKLATLPPGELRDELSRSREVLQENLQEPIDLFCHPYGFPSANLAYVERLRDLLRSTGYTVATTTNVGRASRGGDPLLLPRLPVNGADDPLLFSAKLQGAYDWTSRPQAVLKHVKRLLRRAA